MSKSHTHLTLDEVHTQNEVNFKVKHEDHRKCLKTYFMRFLKVFSDHDMIVKMFDFLTFDYASSVWAPY